MRRDAAGRQLRPRISSSSRRERRHARAHHATSAALGTLDAITDTSSARRGPAQRVTQRVSQRLLVVWAAFAPPRPPTSGARSIAHELTHAALARETSGRTPTWLVEGMALYVSGDDRAARRRALTGASADARDAAAACSPRALASRRDDRLNAAQARAYAYSSAAAYAIADRYGPHRAAAALRRVQRRAHPRPRRRAELTDKRALHRAI